MFIGCILGLCNFDSIGSFFIIQDFKMTGRESVELDTLQHRLYLDRFQRMELIQKIFNELPKADQ